MSVLDIACHYVSSSSSSASVFICRNLNVPRSGSYLTYTNLKDGDCTLWTFYPAVSHHYLKRAMASMASHGFTEASTQVLITKKCSVHRALAASHPYVLVFWRVVWNTSCNPAALEVSCFLISTAWRTLWIKKNEENISDRWAVCLQCVAIPPSASPGVGAWDTAEVSLFKSMNHHSLVLNTGHRAAVDLSCSYRWTIMTRQ